MSKKRTILGVVSVLGVLLAALIVIPEPAPYPAGLTGIEREAAERAVYEVEVTAERLPGMAPQLVSVAVERKSAELCEAPRWDPAERDRSTFTARVRMMWGAIPTPLAYEVTCYSVRLVS
jgi:hypothetical protein